ncbi:MAG: serine/threonine-protein kinase [Phycisphaerae bacterium]
MSRASRIEEPSSPQCIERVLEDVIRRREAGEDVDEAQIVDAHSELMPELGEKLCALRSIEVAEHRARSECGHAEEPSTIGTSAPGAGRRGFPIDIPGYRFVGEICRGGQGVVYRAIQENTRRDVAIKTMHAGPFMGPHEEARFEREVRILAQLKHPNIITIHDSGVVAGTHYYVMDYIEGVPLDQYFPPNCAVKRKLELFATICEAINAAHLRGIIHRDLKPSNVRINAAGDPFILDFGLAKMAGEVDDLTRARDLTVTGQFVGSLPWASPEQADGGPEIIDVRSDVYSLGVMLYQALTGRFPYVVVGKMRDVLGHILKTDPIRPRSVQREIDEETETIVLKCLNKDPQRRYQSAGALALDIRRYLNNEPIDAKRDSTLYMLRKHVRRHRVPLAVGAVFVVLLVVSSVVAWTLYLRSQESLRSSYLAQAQSIRASDRPGRRFNALEVLGKAAAIRPSIELRNEAIAAMAGADLRIIKQVKVETGGSLQILTQFSEELDMYSLCDESTGKTTVHRFSDDKTLLELPALMENGVVVEPRFSRDGRYLARGAIEEVEVWDIERARLVTTIAVDIMDFVQPLDFSPDASELAIGTHDGSIHVVNLTTQATRVIQPIDFAVHFIRYDPAGRRMAVSSHDTDEVVICDAHSGDTVHRLKHPSGVWRVAWSSDGRQLGVGCSDGNVYVWNTQTGRQRFRLTGHQSDVDMVGFNPAGDLLFSSSWDGTTRFWDPRVGDHLFTAPATAARSFASHSNRLSYLTFRDGFSVGISEVERGEALRSFVGRPISGRDDVRWIASSNNGRWLTISSAGGVRIWSVVTGQEMAFLPTGYSTSVFFLPGDSFLITVSAYEVLKWPIAVNQDVLKIGPPESLLHQSDGELKHACIRASAGALTVASRGDGRAYVLDVDGANEPRPIGSHRGITSITVSPNGAWLATATWKGTGVKIWDFESGDLVHELPVEGSARVKFSPDGEWLVTSAAEYVIWEVGTWKARARFPVQGYTSLPGPIAFSADGGIAALSCRAPSIDLIDLRQMRKIARLDCPGVTAVGLLDFTPDGTKLAYPKEGHIVYMWNLRAVRRQLAAAKLDWDLPPYPPATPTESVEPLRVELDLGHLAPNS